jgi:uroporphyrin-III C-methyltransferase/precorrin-2 dehydrogenase/sirohydrochlorin ferrochelatase
MDYLPVFLDLRGRMTLVVGGGAVALRKVELLLKAQARVRVVSPLLCAELTSHRDAGRIEHVAGSFDPPQFDAIAFAIAATDDAAVNRAVAQAGAVRGIWVNVVDDADASSCVMPAIVDRSPVIVAIGSSGQSPTLARRLRAQLEAQLPARLGELARFTGAMRERVRRIVPDLTQRRRLWERVLSSPAAHQLLAGTADAGSALEHEFEAAAAAGPPRGEVYLIGAGPGDPDLLTLRALQLLQQADVVLYDRLVSEAVLERVRRDAERVFVGKESGQHRVTQERIHALLLEYAGRGLRVARLKGGDPFIFGRGGEEIAVLARAGVPVTVVPGITAALGAAASAGLSLTHRGVSQAVCFVTAMGEGAEGLDWRALSAPLTTVVFYMGVSQLPRIVERLIAHGAPAERPAAVIERATLPGQRVITGTLTDIAARAGAAAISAPALLVVGDVVTHRQITAELAISFDQYTLGREDT